MEEDLHPHLIIDSRGHLARAPRYSVLLHGHISRFLSQHRMPIRVRNIAMGGLMGECAYPVWSDERVEIHLASLGVLFGRIRWGKDRCIGVQFDGPIDPTMAWFHPAPWHCPFDFAQVDTRRPAVRSTH